jgi:hypothetical protein
VTMGINFQVDNWEFLNRCASVIFARKILLCKESNYAEILSLTRGRVCPLPQSHSAVISLLSVCTIYILHAIKCIYNMYKASVSPGSVRQIMPYH